jgi:hypothetical protein
MRVKIQDGERVPYATQLVSVIQANLGEKPYEDIDSITEYMSASEAYRNLNKKNSESVTPVMASVVLLLCLKTRLE